MQAATIPTVELAQSIAFMLTARILDLVKESGADPTEARSALDGAVAFLPELNLQPKAITITSVGSAQDLLNSRLGNS